MREQSLRLGSDQEAQEVFGRHDSTLRRVEQEFHVDIVGRSEQITIRGNATHVQQALGVLTALQQIAQTGQPIARQTVDDAIRAQKRRDTRGVEPTLTDVMQDRIDVPARRRAITPRTPGQQAYVEAMRSHDIVFGIGPAGTGKTFLAMAMAVSALTRGDVSRIILTRPAVEAGEQLGFLPGDLQAKITPYLRPLYDALYVMMEPEQIQRAVDRGIIEIAPLAYMRGRTLNDSFVIMDEAQNSTVEQMKMFLTRLGFDSKTVIAGDITQIDLPKHRISGLAHASQILRDIPGLALVSFTGHDVVRHELVQKIITAYERRPVRRRRSRA
jgi:phosphate starvation-inducible protein PhoH and related proteins